MITFYNHEGLIFGKMDGNDVCNTSFDVGSVETVETVENDGGGMIYSRTKDKMALLVAWVTADGSVYHNKTGLLSRDFDKETNTVKQPKKSDEMRIGRVEVIGGVGMAYNREGEKRGEVKGAQEKSKILAGAMLALLVEENVDPKNAPYFYSHRKFAVADPPYAEGTERNSDGALYTADYTDNKPKGKLGKLIRFLTK